MQIAPAALFAAQTVLPHQVCDPRSAATNRRAVTATCVLDAKRSALEPRRPVPGADKIGTSVKTRVFYLVYSCRCWKKWRPPPVLARQARFLAGFGPPESVT
jgi:hypothetical protein